MLLEKFIKEMPKVELHVHLEGSIQPQTLLTLAKRNQVQLPANTIEELQEWYTFTNFDHFLEIYLASSRCIVSAEDIEFITREFLKSQAEQNIIYSEVIYTAHTHYRNYQISFYDQLAAINRARNWAESQLGVTMGLIVDISRERTSEEGYHIAGWAIEGMEDGVIALGLGGPEKGNPPEKFKAAFDRANDAGLACLPHAGETAGAKSIWGALRSLHAKRIGHGVRCLEDPVLVDELRLHQIPLEVCPTSNVCLKVFPGLADHPLPHLLSEGLYVTINSDDPPMFGTTLTNEYLSIANTFGFDVNTIEHLMQNAVRATLLEDKLKLQMEYRFKNDIKMLRKKYQI